MSRLTIITYTSRQKKGIKQTERSLSSQTFNDFEWLLLDDTQKTPLGNSDYYLFLKPGEKIINQDILQLTIANSYNEDIVFGNAFVERPLNRRIKVGTEREDVSLFHMMEYPIPLCSAFIKSTLIENNNKFDVFNDPIQWLQFLLNEFFLKNCTLKHTNTIISSTIPESYKTMYNIKKYQQEEIISTIMPRLINNNNKLYSQSETNEAQRLFFFLQHNKIALFFYNRFIKPKGGLDA